MVRRSTADRSPQSAVHGTGYEPAPGAVEPGRDARGSSSTWGGAGGRWLVWTFRVILWAVVLIVGYRGVTAIVLGETQPRSAGAGGASANPASRFPVTLADAYALQFGEVYLNFSPGTAGQRASQLAGFVSTGSNSQLGWNGTGSLQLQSEQVAGTNVLDASHAVVTLLAEVNGGLMELGVPIYATHTGLAVAGEPAWLPAPSQIPVPSPAFAGTDSATQTVLMSQLPAFFQAYASGNQVTLGRFLAPGAAVSGLGGPVVYKDITNIIVPPGGAIRHITATVLWNVPARGGATKKGGVGPAGLEMSYALTIVERGGYWYVRDVSAAAASQGSP
jgi:hypothetical protein